MYVTTGGKLSHLLDFFIVDVGRSVFLKWDFTWPPLDGNWWGRKRAVNLMTVAIHFRETTSDRRRKSARGYIRFGWDEWWIRCLCQFFSMTMTIAMRNNNYHAKRIVKSVIHFYQSSIIQSIQSINSLKCFSDHFFPKKHSMNQHKMIGYTFFYWVFLNAFTAT